MLIDFSKLSDNDRHGRSTDWRYEFLLTIMGLHTENACHWKEAFGVDISQHPIMLDVKITVNGVEMPFDKYIEYLEKCYSDMLERHANELINEKFNKLRESIEKLEREANHALAESFYESANRK